MKTLTLAAVGVACALATTPALAQNGDAAKIGRLECNIEGGVGLILGSSKSAVCQYYDIDSTDPVETYYGKVTKFGIDIGVTNATTVQWIVLAPTLDAYSSGALAGRYVGVSAEATAGAGVGANVLVGGSDKSFTLQPVSVQAQTGLNIAAGVTGFELKPAEDIGL